MNSSLNTWQCGTCSMVRSSVCRPAGCYGDTLDRRDLNEHARLQAVEE